MSKELMIPIETFKISMPKELMIPFETLKNVMPKELDIPIVTIAILKCGYVILKLW